MKKWNAVTANVRVAVAHNEFRRTLGALALLAVAGIFPLHVSAQAPTRIALIIDEDAIDNSTLSIQDISFGAPFCGGPVGGVGDPSVCVNDDIADPSRANTPLFDAPRQPPACGYYAGAPDWPGR